MKPLIEQVKSNTRCITNLQCQIDELEATGLSPVGPTQKTKGVVNGGGSQDPALLEFDNNLLFGGPSQSTFTLPNVTVPGVEVIIDSTSSVACTIQTFNNSAAFETSWNSSTSQIQVAQNELYKFISLGSNYWLVESMQRSPVKLNGAYLGNGGFSYTLITNNSTTSALTAAQLNASYPNSFTMTGIMVCCKDIVGGGIAYIKTGVNSWISTPITTVT